MLFLVGGGPCQEILSFGKINMLWCMSGGWTQKSWGHISWTPLGLVGKSLYWRPPWLGGASPTPIGLLCNLHYNWGKSLKTSVKVFEWCWIYMRCFVRWEVKEVIERSQESCAIQWKAATGCWNEVTEKFLATTWLGEEAMKTQLDFTSQLMSLIFSSISIGSTKFSYFLHFSATVRYIIWQQNEVTW